MPIELEKAKEEQCITSLQRYCHEVMGVDTGHLKAKLFLQYVLQEIGPFIYNQAIAHAQAHLQTKVGELEDVCFVPELTYWKGKKR